MEELSENSFCFGAFYGAIAAGIVGSVLRYIREARVKSGLKNRSLDQFPDSAQPNLTSSGIVKTSREAFINMILWSFLLIFFAGIAIAGVYYLLAQ